MVRGSLQKSEMRTHTRIIGVSQSGEFRVGLRVLVKLVVEFVVVVCECEGCSNRNKTRICERKRKRKRERA